MTERQTILRTAGASHFLVKFEVDDCLCVVGRKYILDPEQVGVGGSCQVKWNGSELLMATVIAMGEKQAMEKVEEEQLQTMYQDKTESTPAPPPPPKKAKLNKGKENKKNTPHRKTCARRKPFTNLQNGKKGEFTFELGSPAKLTSPLAQSTPATEDLVQSTPATEDLPPAKDLLDKVDAVNSPVQSLSISVSSTDSDAVHPHPSPRKKICINIDSYDENHDLNSAHTNPINKLSPDPTMTEVLSSISSTVNIINSKLTLVNNTVKSLNERQDRLETSLEELKSVLKPILAHKHSVPQVPVHTAPVPPPQPPVPPPQPPQPPVPPPQPPVHPPQPPQPPVPPPQPPVHPPPPPVPQPTGSAPDCLSTSAFAHPPSMWYANVSSSYLEEHASQPQAPVPQPQSQAAQPTTVSAFAHPPNMWYANVSSSFVEEPANHDREYIEHGKIMDMKSSGISRKNFAKKLVAMIFTEAERSTCNVNGRNKPKLDPIRIAYVKTKTFQMYPLNAQVEKLDKAWSECVIAIDEGNRRLNRKGKAN